MANDDRYKYYSLKRPAIEVSTLDSLAKNVLKDAGWFGLIKGFIMMSFYLVYVFGRKNLVDQEMAYNKQEYERKQAGEDQDNLDGDDQDAVIRPPEA